MRNTLIANSIIANRGKIRIRNYCILAFILANVRQYVTPKLFGNCFGVLDPLLVYMYVKGQVIVLFPSGRKLRVPDEWENPSGEWHVGVKAIFQLFPNHLKGRLQVCVCVCECVCL